jgi:hypothetical protein
MPREVGRGLIGGEYIQRKPQAQNIDGCGGAEKLNLEQRMRHFSQVSLSNLTPSKELRSGTQQTEYCSGARHIWPQKPIDVLACPTVEAA